MELPTFAVLLSLFAGISMMFLSISLVGQLPYKWRTPAFGVSITFIPAITIVVVWAVLTY